MTCIYKSLAVQRWMELLTLRPSLAKLTAVDWGEVASPGQAVDDAHGAAGALVRHGAQCAAAVRTRFRRAGHQGRLAVACRK